MLGSAAAMIQHEKDYCKPLHDKLDNAMCRLSVTSEALGRVSRSHSRSVSCHRGANQPPYQSRQAQAASAAEAIINRTKLSIAETEIRRLKCRLERFESPPRPTPSIKKRKRDFVCEPPGGQIDV